VVTENIGAKELCGRLQIRTLVSILYPILRVEKPNQIKYSFALGNPFFPEVYTFR
jgi:hypothetical protein